MLRRRRYPLTKDLAMGAIGGVLGTMAMGKLSTFLYKYENEDKKKREEHLRPEPPFMVMAEMLGKKTLKRELSQDEKNKAGKAIHWGYGISWGMGYALIRRKLPFLSKASGIPFAILFSLIGDELANTTFKLAPPPQKFPWEAHARGLAGHLAFTAAVDSVLKATSRRSA